MSKNWDDLPNIKDRLEGMEQVGIRLYISCGFVLDSLSHLDAGDRDIDDRLLAHDIRGPIGCF